MSTDWKECESNGLFGKCFRRYPQVFPPSGPLDLTEFFRSGSQRSESKPRSVYDHGSPSAVREFLYHSSRTVKRKRIKP